MEHSGLAYVAYQICEKLRQPKHSAAFDQAALQSCSLTWGFKRLAHRPSRNESHNNVVPTSQRRSVQLRTLQEVLQDSHWQHVMPGAFSEATLSLLADCCKKDWPKSPYVSVSWPMILKSHQMWTWAVAPLWTRYTKLFRCVLYSSNAAHEPMQAVCVAGLYRPSTRGTPALGGPSTKTFISPCRLHSTKFRAYTLNCLQHFTTFPHVCARRPECTACASVTELLLLVLLVYCSCL